MASSDEVALPLCYKEPPLDSTKDELVNRVSMAEHVDMNALKSAFGALRTASSRGAFSQCNEALDVGENNLSALSFGQHSAIRSL